jgi:hypothetical protein
VTGGPLDQLDPVAVWIEYPRSECAGLEMVEPERFA